MSWSRLFREALARQPRKQLLAERLAVLSPGCVRAIDSAIAFALGLEV
jgi:hypothetical protein